MQRIAVRLYIACTVTHEMRRDAIDLPTILGWILLDSISETIHLLLYRKTKQTIEAEAGEL